MSIAPKEKHEKQNRRFSFGWGTFVKKCHLGSATWDFDRLKWKTVEVQTKLVGGFKYFLFLSLFGEDSHLDY